MTGLAFDLGQQRYAPENAPPQHKEYRPTCSIQGPGLAVQFK